MTSVMPPICQGRHYVEALEKYGLYFQRVVSSPFQMLIMRLKH